uniref:Endoglucanase n=1 Tax=uncultured bacterium contig00016 TaxID=1181507 RepID=A0A806KJ50_9BACT|nr:glycoside hydrolase family 9 [uncultured bacterium contig00016]
MKKVKSASAAAAALLFFATLSWGQGRCYDEQDRMLSCDYGGACFYLDPIYNSASCPELISSCGALYYGATDYGTDGGCSYYGGTFAGEPGSGSFCYYEPGSCWPMPTEDNCFWGELVDVCPGDGPPGGDPNNNPSFTAKAHVNQIGFGANAQKQAVYNATAGAPGTITLRNISTSSSVKTITPGTSRTWSHSGESSNRILDFSDITTPGHYALYEGSTKISADFEIGNDYTELLRDALRYYYLHRADIAIVAPYSESPFLRDAGHSGLVACVINSTNGECVAGQNVTSYRGWYDAGDYGRYVVNSGISTYTLLALYEKYASKIPHLNIPADPEISSLPDLLAEIKWNLDWMLTMQASDGGVYHKMTGRDFSGFVPPAEDDAVPLVAVWKTTAATLNFAAVMAVASRVYRPFNTAYANQMLTAAKAAWMWAKANPSVLYGFPTDERCWSRWPGFNSPVPPNCQIGTGTGQYEDNDVAGEFFFAAAALATVTSGSEQSEFLTAINTYRGGSDYRAGSVAGWQDVGGLGTYEIARSDIPTHSEAAKTALIAAANSLVATSNSNSYGLPFNHIFWWGSNSIAGNMAIKLMEAFELTGTVSYKNTAQAVLDYLLGRNPLDQSYVTGFGTRYAADPHDRVSESAYHRTVPGMLVGGPAASGCTGSDNFTTALATRYQDLNSCYGYNEITINWNAPLVYLAAALSEYARFSISLNKHTHNFPAAEYGYGAQTAETITISNTGEEATGALTLALSGTNASDFTISATSIPSIAIDGEATFTIRPNTGLNAGTHTATVRVSGSNISYKEINVSFTVNPIYVTITPNAGQSKVFGSGADPALTYTNSASLASSQFTGALSRAAGANAGQYPIELGTLSAGGNYALTLSATTVYFTIEKATGLSATPHTLYVKANRNDNFNLNGIELNKHDAGDRTFSLGAFTDADNILTAKPEISGHAISFNGSSTAALGNDNATLEVNITTHNYEDITATLIFEVTNLPIVTLGSITISNKTFDGNPIAISGTITATDDAGHSVAISSIDLVYTWEGVDHSYYNTAAPINAGEYRLVISGTGDEMIVENLVIEDIVINRKKVTITGVDQSITVGETPATFTAEIVGEVTGHPLTNRVITAQCEYENAVGEYDIIPDPSSDASGNYDIEYVNGTLTITEADPVIGPQIASGSIRAYATGNAIILENLPKNAKVEMYNLQGKRLYSAHSGNSSQILKILVQTKGMYIVSVKYGSERKALRMVVR